MKYERLKELMAKPGLSVKEMREKDQLVNELLPWLIRGVEGIKWQAHLSREDAVYLCADLEEFLREEM